MATMRIYLGHGASGTAASMAPHVEGLRRRGFDAQAIDLPKRKAEDAVPVFGRIVPNEPDVVIGGHSYGGRVASLAAAAPDARYRALVCFSYPLHAPGRAETWEGRAAHLVSIGCPVLFLSGDADPFARIDLLRQAVTLVPRAELVTYPRLGHGLAPVLDDALDRVTAFLAALDQSEPARK
jgi:uncharacterized protein